MQPLILLSYLMRVRRTVRLDSDLVDEAKRVADSSGRTLTAVIEEALRESLGRAKFVTSGLEGEDIPTFGGRGLRPGVDLDDSAALLKLIEGDRDSQRRKRTNPYSPGKRR